uniref:U6 small nuclear RNA (adenine-(43)-N(6))-methyltransferase n=1 Tax=Strongyloides papillosus TaxID=174720 RepID=A0A0N5B8X6_STREA
MHPRNVFFNNDPDFNGLAMKYEELRKVCRLNKKGKFQVNFQDHDSSRVVAEVLLKEYFSLDVSFNRNHLIPRISNRLDYLLIIEDFLKTNFKETEQFYGIDIGVGANCIYPLLGTQIMKWNFIGIDIDDEAIVEGNKIISNNNLTSKILLIKKDEVNDNNTFALGVKNIPENAKIFSICNPPFFDDKEVDRRFVGSDGLMINMFTSERHPPSSTTVARGNELSTTGGEVKFIEKMIEDSQDEVVSKRISLFTSLIGKKKSIKMIEDILENINCCWYKFYEMRHGKTSRWIVMWTFTENHTFPTQNWRKRKNT